MNLKHANDKIQVISRQIVLGKELTVYGTRENPVFLAKDIAKWLGQENASQMVQTVDDDEKLVYTIHMSGQMRNCIFLTEDGLYEVLMMSRKPIAKSFKQEVKRILHSLRTKGICLSTKAIGMAKSDSDYICELAKAIVDEMQARKCLELEKEMLEGILDKTKAELMVERYFADNYRNWKGHVGRKRKGWKDPKLSGIDFLL